MPRGSFPPVKVPTLTNSPEGPALGRGLPVSLSLPWPGPAGGLLPVLAHPSLPARPGGKIKPAFLPLPRQANLSAGRGTLQGVGGLRAQLFAAAAARSTWMKDAPGTNQHDHSSVRMKIGVCSCTGSRGLGSPSETCQQNRFIAGELTPSSLALRLALMA